jgi:hypothetical protein
MYFNPWQALYSFGAVAVYQSTRSIITEEFNLYQHRCEHLKACRKCLLTESQI